MTLYRVNGGTLDRVWSRAKSIDPEATGYLGTLERVEQPGVYRLEVTRNDQPIASAMVRMNPPCSEGP